MRPAIFVLVILAALAALYPSAARAQDSDSDGMPDLHEFAYLCLDPSTDDSAADPDSDGLTSLQEYTYSPFLDPCVDDTDGDGVKDGAEVASGTDPLLLIVAPTPRYLSLPQDLSTWAGYSTLAIWTGSEYYAGNPYNLNRFNAAGLMQPGMFFDYDYSWNDLAWTGSELVAVSAGDDRFLRFTPDLVLISADTVSPFDQVAWTGSEFGALNTTGDKFFRVSPQAYQIGAAVSVPAGAEQLLWTGSEFVVFDSGDAMVRISADGTLIGSVAIACNVYAVVWTGAGFLADIGIGLQEISPTGSLVGPAQGGYFNFPRAVPELGLVIDHDGYDFVVYGHDGTEEGRLPANWLQYAFTWNGTSVGVFGALNENLIFATIAVGDRDGDFLLDKDETGGLDPDDWDTDNDGMGDGYEVGHSCLQPLAADAGGDDDADGIANGGEAVYQTDPCSADTDGDGLADLDETAGTGTDPLSADSDGDGLSDGWEAGVVVGAGPNGTIETSAAAGDSLHDGAIWLGDDHQPGSSAAGDDIQVVPLTTGLPRFFLTDPTEPDSDGDGVKDGFEVKHGSEPNDAAITPRLVKIADNPLEEQYTQLSWTGSEYLALIHDDIRITPDCESNIYACWCNLYFQRLTRYGKPISKPRLLLENIRQSTAGAWAGNEYWIDAYTDHYLFLRLNAEGRRVAEDQEVNVNLRRAIWNGSQMFSLSTNYNTDTTTLYLFGPGGTPLASTFLPDHYYMSWPCPVWTGSEYGIAIADYYGISFVRVSDSLDLISDQHISSLDTYLGGTGSVIWSGSEYFLTSSVDYMDLEVSCEEWPEYCHDESVLFRLDAEGRTINSFFLPTPGSNKYSAYPGSTSLAMTGDYIGWVTPDLTHDSDGYCGEDDCVMEGWLHWLTPNGEEIGLSTYLGKIYARHRPVNGLSLDYIFFPDFEAPHATSFSAFSPDSDGDGVPDEFECGADSASDWDSDSDGTADGLSDGDGDGLTSADEAVTYHTDPCNPDTDGDGASDGKEVARGTDPLKKAANGGGGGGGGGGCAMAPAGTGVAETGAGGWLALPFLLVLALRRLRRK